MAQGIFKSGLLHTGLKRFFSEKYLQLANKVLARPAKFGKVSALPCQIGLKVPTLYLPTVNQSYKHMDVRRIVKKM